MNGCPGCGLFLHHAEGCRGVIAVYWRYLNRCEEEGFFSVDEALAFLCHGEDDGGLSSEAVLWPDDTTALDDAAITAIYVKGPPWRAADALEAAL